MVKLTENYIRRLLNTSDQSNLEAIQILELRNENITSIKIDAFSSFKDLTELDLSNNRLTNIGLEFNSLENLEKLNLSNNKIKFININAFSNLVNLEMIDLSTNDLNCISEHLFGGLTNLTTIYLNENSFEEERLCLNLESRVNFVSFKTNTKCNQFKEIDNVNKEFLLNQLFVII